MENTAKMIRETNTYGIAMQAVQKPFNAHLKRWHQESNPEDYNRNFFTADGPLTMEDVAEALECQKKLGVHHFLLKMSQPLDEAIVERFGLEPDHSYIMALREQEKSREWKTNPKIVVKDCQKEDMYADILAHSVNKAAPKWKELVCISMTKALEEAKAHPEYHWLEAYLDGKIVGDCYILCHNGCIELDDLNVDKEVRKQYIATTLMKYVAENFDGLIYVHAAINRTPKDMYAKMGFEIVDSLYEYVSVWK